MKKFSTLTLLSSTLLCLSACQLGSQMKDMQNNTAHMDKTTDSMNQTMDGMNQTTGQMNQTTTQMNNKMGQMNTAVNQTNANMDQMKAQMDNVKNSSQVLVEQTIGLHDDLIQGDSVGNRRLSLQTMANAGSFSLQISEAVKYFMGFEFQFWTPDFDAPGSQKNRDNEGALAVQEFFADVAQFIPHGKMVPKPLAMPDETNTGKESLLSAIGDTLARPLKDNLSSSFNALAASCHILDRKQSQMLEQYPQIQPMSVYAMVEASLLLKTARDSGKLKAEDTPAYVKEVLFQEQEALYLLQARYNSIATIVLARLTNIGNDNTLAFANVLKMSHFSWKVDLAKINADQLGYLNQFLHDSLEARDFLIKIGQTPMLDATVHKMFINMQVDATAKPTSEELSTGQELFVKQVNQLRL